MTDMLRSVLLFTSLGRFVTIVWKYTTSCMLITFCSRESLYLYVPLIPCVEGLSSSPFVKHLGAMVRKKPFLRRFGRRCRCQRLPWLDLLSEGYTIVKPTIHFGMKQVQN